MSPAFIVNRNIRRRLYVLMFLLTLFSSNAVLGWVSAASEPEKHFLWSMKTRSNTVFFLGSLHVLKGDAYPLAPGIEKAYEAAQKIVFETDVDKTQDPRWQGRMMALGVYLNGQTIAQNVSRETYRLLEEKVVAAGMPMASFNSLKPWLCALTLSVMELQKLGYDPSSGIDMYFHDKAKKDGKEIIALEPPEFQLKLFATMDKKEEEAFLRQTLEELEVTGTLAHDMQEAWKKGDVEKLDAIMKLSFKDHPDMYERFVLERNRKWAAIIDELARSNENVLIVVGSAHLVGKNSVLDLLKAKGYSIEQR
jgi:uncharacterized protein YbaP (TraB family)